MLRSSVLLAHLLLLGSSVLFANASVAPAAAAEEDDANPQILVVGADMKDLRTLQAEFAHNANVVEQLGNLFDAGFTHSRPVQGDGNSFYYSFAFLYLQHDINRLHFQLKARAALEYFCPSKKDFPWRAWYCHCVAEEDQVTRQHLDRLTDALQTNPAGFLNRLVGNADDGLGDVVVRFTRLVMAHVLHKALRESLSRDGIPVYAPVFGTAQGVLNFLEKHLHMTEDAEGEPLFETIAVEFGVNLYLHGVESMNEGWDKRFQGTADDERVIHVMWRPDQYDILYTLAQAETVGRLLATPSRPFAAAPLPISPVATPPPSPKSSVSSSHSSRPLPPFLSSGGAAPQHAWPREQLLAMGYAEAQVDAALKRSSSVEAAVEWIRSLPDSSGAPGSKAAPSRGRASSSSHSSVALLSSGGAAQQHASPRDGALRTPLLNMGYTEAQVDAAVKRSSSIQAAVEWISSGSPSAQAPPADA